MSDLVTTYKEMRSLQRERDRLEAERWDHSGTVCGACGQRVKAYRRNIYGTQAKGLCVLAAAYLRDRRLGKEPKYHEMDGRDICKLVYWELVEGTERGQSDLPKSRLWRATEKGVAFARNEVAVPKYIYVYNNELLSIDKEPVVWITDVLPEGFDYWSIWETGGDHE